MDLKRLFSFQSVLGTFRFYQVLVTVAIGIAAVGAGYVITYRNAVSRLEQSAELTTKTATDILSQPLWNYDTDTMTRYADILTRSDTVCKVEIRSNDHRLLAGKTHHLDGEGTRAPHFSRSAPVYYQHMKIGTVSISFPLFKAYARARHTVVTMGVMAILLLTVILLLSQFQVRRFILQPLAELMDQIREIADGDYSEKLSILQKSEYMRIAGEFNAMVDRIRQREEEIQAAGLRYETLLQTIPDAFLLHERSGPIVQVNETFTRMYGYHQDEAAALSVADLSGKGYTEAMAREKLFAAWDRGEVAFRWVARRKDGTEFPVEVRLKRVALGDHSYIMALVRDISLREQAERRLRESEQRFRAMADNTTSAIFVYEEKFLFVNPATERISGYSQQELQSMNFWEMVHPDHREMVRERGHARLQGSSNIPSQYRFMIQTKTGEDRWVEFAAQQIEYEGRSCALGTAVDITDKVLAQQALREEKERLRVTLQSIGDAVIATDRNGRVVLMNSVAARLCGWKESEALGQHLGQIFQIIHEHTREPIPNPVDAVMKTGKIVSLSNHTVLVNRNGEEHIIADSGAPIRSNSGDIIGVVLVFRDETEKKQVEEELFRSRKLESIGLLAGGIAHDFNNLLTAILGNLEMAKIKHADLAASSNLAEAENAIERARDLARQLLTFSKGGAPIKQRMDIGNLLKDTTRFVLAGTAVSPRFYIPDDLPPLEADPGQISQVIQNLVLNASQAMPEGGIIDVAAEVALIQDHPSLPTGEYVRIFIRDYGIGIPKNFQSKIFDPYFTTKEKGNGLGLSTAYSIIRRHEGHIELVSEPGLGATFTIYLPVPSKSARAPIAVPASSASHPEPMGVDRPLSILIMDDEDSILEILGEMLSFMGHRVIETRDGAEAIEEVQSMKEKGTPVDVVILDLTVPGGMGGKETVLALKEKDPSLKAIVSSGYANDPVMANFKDYGFDEVVTKPFKMDELKTALNQLGIGRAPSSATEG